MSSRSGPQGITEHVLRGVNERFIEACLGRGLRVELVKPDVNQRLITVKVTASRAEYLEAKRAKASESHSAARMEFDEREYLRRPPTVEGWERARVSPIRKDIVVETCQEHGLRCRVIYLHKEDDFVIVELFATRPQYKAAQLEWLQRMIA